MASLYKRPNSSFYWIKFRDHLTRKVRRIPTEFLVTNAVHRQRARELCAEKSLLEARSPMGTSVHRWDVWVPGFLSQRHALVPLTLSRKLTSWRRLSEYLNEIKVITPQQLTRQHCLDYVAWRKAKGHQNSPTKRSICHNSVLMEIKCLSSVVQECVRRGWVSGNVCHRLELGRELPREKAELSDEQVEFIRGQIQQCLMRALKTEKSHADFLHISFEIALAQGCRMAETWMPLTSVNLKEGEITLVAKGNKRYVAPLNPALVPLFKALVKEGKKYTYERPRMPSLVWFKFFDRLRKIRPDLINTSFHSTRVSVVSRAERAGVPEKVAMALVNHSSTTVHRIYRKIKKQELEPMWKALGSLNAK